MKWLLTMFRAGRRTCSLAIRPHLRPTRCDGCFIHCRTCLKVLPSQLGGRSSHLGRLDLVCTQKVSSRWSLWCRELRLMRCALRLYALWAKFPGSCWEHRPCNTTGSPYNRCGPICLNKACSNLTLCDFLSVAYSAIFDNLPHPSPFPPPLLTRPYSTTREETSAADRADSVSIQAEFLCSNLILTNLNLTRP